MLQMLRILVWRCHLGKYEQISTAVGAWPVAIRWHLTRPDRIAVYARLALEIAVFGSNFARLTLKKALTLRTLASLVNRRCAKAW